MALSEDLHQIINASTNKAIGMKPLTLVVELLILVLAQQIGGDSDSEGGLAKVRLLGNSDNYTTGDLIMSILFVVVLSIIAISIIVGLIIMPATKIANTLLRCLQ